LIARFNAALELLKQQPEVDAEKIAAIGYCFGGAVALTMARQGADLDAVGTFHASLKPVGAPAEKGKVKARILAFVGAEDPMIPKDQVQEFEKEMKAAGAKAEVVTFPKARHSFTNPDADKVGMDALKYDADADKKSFDQLLALFKKTFGK